MSTVTMPKRTNGQWLSTTEPHLLNINQIHILRKVAVAMTSMPLQQAIFRLRLSLIRQQTNSCETGFVLSPPCQFWHALQMPADISLVESNFMNFSKSRTGTEMFSLFYYSHATYLAQLCSPQRSAKV